MAASHIFLRRKHASTNLHTNVRFYQVRTYACMLHTCIRPTERSEACSERCDEVRDCRLHITQAENCR